MSENPEEINPEDLPPEIKKHLDEFEALMKDINDPVANGYAVITEMYNGFRTAGMERIDAYCLVAAYLVMHDHLGREENS
jgi:hypothetical protein